MSESNTYTNLFSKGANTSREHGEMPITTPSHVFIVLAEVSVLIRRQQIAPKSSIFSFRGSEVKRKAERIAETFKDAIKDVVHGE